MKLNIQMIIVLMKIGRNILRKKLFVTIDNSAEKGGLPRLSGIWQQ